MESTANPQLPYIMPSQAQKHVTHNDALMMLDAIVQLAVVDRDRTDPPEEAGDGERYIVAAGGAGEWEGWDGAVALRMDGGWLRLEPQSGWLAWVDDERIFLRWTGSAWTDLAACIGVLQNVSLLGVGAVADASNPFSARLNRALWTAKYAGDGGDGSLRYVLNKEGTGGTLSMIMQTGWSGRAEIGLIGDDSMAIKVSADGATWKQALRVDPSSAAASFPNTPALNAIAALTGQNGAFARFTGASAASMQAIVGTVSQAGGTPTGAIVETASNANGRYVRWADGTQIVMKTLSGTSNITDALGALYQSTSSILTGSYAAVFATAPSVWLDTSASANRSWPVSITAGAAGSGPAIRLLSPTSESAVAYTINVLCIGRWF